MNPSYSNFVLVLSTEETIDSGKYKLNDVTLIVSKIPKWIITCVFCEPLKRTHGHVEWVTDHETQMKHINPTNPTFF